jgi:DNA-binding transcriptional MerR regulator
MSSPAVREGVAMAFEALKVGELARRTGLTVRTLHHYDEIGLLVPSLKTDGGHRLYTEADVARLQQVLSLRQLGFSLEEAGACLRGAAGFSPLRTVRLHAERLRARIEQERALCARLDAIAARLEGAEEVSADELLRLIEEMTMVEQMYSPEQMKKFAEAAKQVGPEEIEAVQNGWTALLADVRAATAGGVDPAGPEARELARRWDDLMERMKRSFAAFPELEATIAENYRQGKFEGFTMAAQSADFAFIERAKAARAGG